MCASRLAGAILASAAVLGIAGGTLPAAAHADSPPSAAPPAPAPTPTAAPPAAAPAEAAPTITLGGDVRVRGYSLANVWDFDHDDDRDRWSVFRYRTRLFVRAELDGGVLGFVRIANQHWGTGVVESVGPDGDLWEADNKSGKLFVDAAWIEWREAFGWPIEARVGRQDVRYGSGFVLFDGQSQLASTAIYLDGVRLRGALGGAVSLDLLYFKDEENRRDDAAADDLTLLGAYLTRTDRRLDGSEELYLLRREDQSLDRRIGLLGARVRHRFAFGLDTDLEGGLQRGDLPGGVDQKAWGVKTEAGLAWKRAPLAPRLFAGWVGLSGDDPATAGTDERWDVFYGGWPQFGDLPAWAFVNLGTGNRVAGRDPGYASGSSVAGEAVYSNLTIATLGIELVPRARWSVRLSGARLGIPEPDRGSSHFGDLAQLLVRHRATEHLSLAAYAALLVPGDAYASGADPAHELFWEVNLGF